jgi:class 3 adenylate cyclase
VTGERRRRLAAILAADVVGYSRLVGADEEGTLARLRALLREVVQPAVFAHGGRMFKLVGDAVLADFPSAVDAVRCAAALQEASRRASRASRRSAGSGSGWACTWAASWSRAGTCSATA